MRCEGSCEQPIVISGDGQLFYLGVEMDLRDAMRDMIVGKYSSAPAPEGVSYSATPDGSGILRTVTELNEEGKLITKTAEITVLCHFCPAQKQVGLEEISHPMHRPHKWAIVLGGIPRKPLRFFICADCVKSIVYNASGGSKIRS